MTTNQKPAKTPEPPRNSEDTVTVRTTMKPNQDLQVTWAEFQDLEAQGLLVTSQKKES